MVRNASAVEDIGIPVLTETLRLVSTLQAILDFDLKFLQFRKHYKGKGVIVVSIAVTAEGLHPSGRNVGKSIVDEMNRASLYGVEGMANVVRLVTHNGINYYENHTNEEIREFGTPGVLLFNAGANRQLAMHVEKVMQVYVLNREMISQEKIKLLQLTAGNGSLKQGSPFKVGVRFFLSETFKRKQFIFKDNLSIKQKKYPKLPKVARVSLDKSTKAKKAKKSNHSITSFFQRRMLLPTAATTTTTPKTTPKTTSTPKMTTASMPKKMTTATPST